jgi:hypothetical protein
LFFWLRFSPRCWGIPAETELLSFALAPVGIVVVYLAGVFAYHHKVVDAKRKALTKALPFVLRITYLLYPIVSSRGFQVRLTL